MSSIKPQTSLTFCGLNLLLTMNGKKTKYWISRSDNLKLLIILFFILKGDFCFYCDSNCSFSNWVLHVLSILHPFRAIFNALLILLPIVIALETFHKNVSAQECQSLLELRKELSNNSNMTKHRELQKDYEDITTNNLSINPSLYFYLLFYIKIYKFV